MTRKLVLAGLSAITLTLAGCGQNTDAPSPAASESEIAGPESAPGVAVSGATVRLPAMAGSPGIAYFTATLSGADPRRIAGVYVEGVGRAEMHETTTTNGISSMKPVKDVALTPDQPTEFKAGGLHVMLFEVGDALKAGGTTEITITLDNGDKVSAPAKVEAFGAAAGMDHDMSAM
ncbi:hypothetical protein GGQ88_002343 [Novosphingobium hassiacum]|uniref:Copper chaperone PCu(A)C n=1 Tax=Novosphingobium hassiacum TaxID=173676 RepID=A0A7W5ZX35_9SPHN|nr:copper chaperone PCu(A)C [Novosphingobium hassiacum]MBB3861071.1 hypothetical protein [Novosphingobium hassiacum]